MINYKKSGEEESVKQSAAGAVYNKSIDGAVTKDSKVEKYSDKIGTGEDAKSSVVWFVITFTLTLYACLISVLIIIDIYNNNGVNVLDNIKESWGVFTPIITLSLGYMFGKAENARLDKQNAVFEEKKQSKWTEQ